MDFRAGNRSGQTLMIAVLIGLMLLISIPIIVFLNQISSQHQAGSQQRNRARGIAEAGITYATQQLSFSSSTWQAALMNSFDGSKPGASATDCNTGTYVASPSGSGQFKLLCSTATTGNPGLQPFQLAVTAVAYLPDKTGNQNPIRAMKAYLSQRTLGVDLANDFHAGAALQLVSTPTSAGTAYPPGPLTVQWGPIVILDTHTFIMQDPLDTNRYPRKFSLGGITGAAYPRAPGTNSSAATTDGKEYFAFASQSFPPLIDENYYMAQALAAIVNTPPIATPNGGSVTSACPGANLNCGYFRPATPGDTLVFNGLLKGVTIYVEGNARFDDVDMDSVAVVVSGNLTLGTHTTATIKPLHVPITASLEYPYFPAWPCQGNEVSGIRCPSDIAGFPGGGGQVQFRGFLYVKGNMIVTLANWNLAGAVLVGDMQATGSNGQLSILGNANLAIAYDDIINHNIQVNPYSGATSIKIVTDSIQNVPTP